MPFGPKLLLIVSQIQEAFLDNFEVSTRETTAFLLVLHPEIRARQLLIRDNGQVQLIVTVHRSPSINQKGQKSI